MQDSSIPTKFPAIWGYGASSPYINAIPTLSQKTIKNGAASLQDGFPPNCFIPYASGGAGPFGGDTNGILNQITGGLQWMQAGGQFPYDATFQTNIGGYPKGAIVASATTFNLRWISTVDNNTTDPDTGGAGWASVGTFSRALQLAANKTIAAIDSGAIFDVTAAGVVVTLPLASSLTNQTGGIIASSVCTLNLTSGTTLEGGALEGATMVSLAVGDFIYWQAGATNWRVLSSNRASAAGATGANPTAQIGNIAVDGTAATFMRSDAAPPLAAGAAVANIGYTPYNATNPAGYITGSDLFLNISHPTRVIGTVYTNSTGKPLMVVVSFSIVSTGTATFYVNGATVGYWTYNSSVSGALLNTSFSVLVPNGSNYELSNATAINAWTEAY